MSSAPPDLRTVLHHGAAPVGRLSAVLGADLQRLLATGLLQRRRGDVIVHRDYADRFTDIAVAQIRCQHAVAAFRLACWMYQAAPFNTADPQYREFLSERGSRLPEVRKTALLPRDHIRSVAGLRVTSPARTLADLGAVCDDNIVERVGEQLLYKRLTTERELADIVDVLSRRGKRGVAALERFLKRRGPGAPATESDLETRFLQASRALGFPEPTDRQLAVARRRGGEPARIDFAWQTPSALVLVEVDGAGTHANPDALIADLRRQNELQHLRPALFRFTADDIDRQPRYIHDALAPWLPTETRPARTPTAQTQPHGVAPHFGQPAA